MLRSKKFLNTAILQTLFFFLLVTQFCTAQDEKTTGRLQNGYSPAREFIKTTNIDSFILATMSYYHIPGLSACIFRDDQIIWKGAYGYADIEHNKHVSDSTLFKLSSLSKPFTGTALMQLWENGLFKLDEDINRYLPFQVRNPNHPADSITFRMLLTHTSSISTTWSKLNLVRTWGGDPQIPLDFFLENYLVPGGVYWANSNYLPWAPLFLYEYSNVGAALVGHLVETISNIPFDQYCKDSIFTPLGMDETAWFLRDLDTNNIAIPYRYWGTYYPYPHYSDAYYPAVGLFSSAVQLSRFLIAFMQNGQIDGIRILDSTTVDLMTTVQYPYLNDQQAIFWFIFPYTMPGFGTYTYCGHAGDNDGVRTAMSFILDPIVHTGIVILTNGESIDGLNTIWDKLYVYSAEITDVAEELNSIPDQYYLSQNFPNPFNSSSIIKYSIPKYSQVTLKIFNILGEEIETLVNEEKPIGTYELTWNAVNLPSGVYFYQLRATPVGGQAGDPSTGSGQVFVQTKKMILLK